METFKTKQELIFPLNINMNAKESPNFIEQKSQPLTTVNSSLSENKSSFTPSRQSGADSKITLISNNSNINNYNLKYLTKYKNIYIPKIFLINYDDSSVYPPKDANTQESSVQNNFNYFNFLSFFNLQNNNSNTNKHYLNYDYNFNQWKEYAKEIRNKYDELNNLVINGKISLPEPNNELEYLMALPSDFGGLGNLYNENKYQNVKFYDPKLPENKDKNFMTEIKFEKKMVWFPLHPNPESLNNKIIPFQIISQFLKNNTNKDDKNNIQLNNDIKKDEQNKIGNKINEKIINNKEDKNFEDNKNKNDKNEKNRFENKEKNQKKYNNKSPERKGRNKSRSRSRSRSKEMSNYRNYINYKNRNSNRYYENNYYYKYRGNGKYFNKYRRNSKNYYY